MSSLLREFHAVRAATDVLFEHLTNEQTIAVGNIEGHSITPRALGYIIIGHSIHHINILRERYLPSM